MSADQKSPRPRDSVDERQTFLDKVILFLSTQPSKAATAPVIAAALGVTQKRVSAMLSRDAGFERLPTATPFLSYRVRESAPDTVVAPSDSHPNTLEAAIAALFAPMAHHIRSGLDAQLERITQDVLSKAVRGAERDIKAQLSDFLRGIDQGELENTGWRAYEDPVRDRTDTPTSTKEQMAALGRMTIPNPGNLQGVGQPPPIVTPKPAPFAFNNPPGDPFVPHDTVSRRTSHKTAGLAMEKAAPANPPLTDDSKPKLPKLLIVGLQDNLQPLIKKEFRDKFILSLFNADRLRAVQAAVKPGDDVICLANHISHKHTDTVKAAGGNVILVYGGMPSLRDELAERYENRVAA